MGSRKFLKFTAFFYLFILAFNSFAIDVTQTDGKSLYQVKVVRIGDRVSFFKCSATDINHCESRFGRESYSTAELQKESNRLKNRSYVVGGVEVGVAILVGWAAWSLVPAAAAGASGTTILKVGLLKTAVATQSAAFTAIPLTFKEYNPVDLWKKGDTLNDGVIYDAPLKVDDLDRFMVRLDETLSGILDPATKKAVSYRKSNKDFQSEPMAETKKRGGENGGVSKDGG